MTFLARPHPNISAKGLHFSVFHYNIHLLSSNVTDYDLDSHVPSHRC